MLNRSRIRFIAFLPSSLTRVASDRSLETPSARSSASDGRTNPAFSSSQSKLSDFVVVMIGVPTAHDSKKVIGKPLNTGITRRSLSLRAESLTFSSTDPVIRTRS